MAQVSGWAPSETVVVEGLQRCAHPDFAPTDGYGLVDRTLFASGRPIGTVTWIVLAAEGPPRLYEISYFPMTFLPGAPPL